ncbi:hypothetical protein [Bacteroides sp. 224]|uniref:hypothetical protein n=1 Tax=Bacteroides sp. 224 TaxID=2302936 RepID=UPI0013CF5057|nr:hypothetical protein [Bacteroides sp. 224]NDV63785.1 hypothetical protein [Bacteroides sp. 224]
MKKDYTNAAPQQMQGKDRNKSQDVEFFAVKKALMECPKSMREVSNELGIERSSICWYIGHLRKADQVQVHHKDYCSTTGFKVNFYTTDEKLFRKFDKQLCLFESDEV